MAATRMLLARDGYDQVTIDSIAREAGVSRPTVYRRWPSKAHVVFEAAFGSPGEHTFESTGNLSADLRAFVRAVLDFWRDPVVEAAALGILADRRRDPELHIRSQQLLDEQTRHVFGALVQRGIDQGAVRADVDADMLYELLIGTTFYQVHVSQRADPDRVIDQLCSLVIRGATRKGNA
jgi:AcrR family transcriptional regulator